MIRIGTCSWTEKTLIESGQFYPRNVTSPEGRLRYYTSRFDTVEVDSVYYAMPDKKTAWLWNLRTPANFIFHIKTYGALTGHGINPRTLPPDLRTMAMTRADQKTVYIRDTTLLELIAGRLHDVLEPLHHAGKLGLMVYQYPPWFSCSSRHFDYLLECRQWTNGLSLAVEFRHGSWLEEKRRREVFRFLENNGITYVSADEPQCGRSTVPFVPAVTGDTAYFRLHGRNRENWLKKGIETSLRYAYLYPDTELEEFLPCIREAESRSENTFVMLNNCHRGFAVQNAARLQDLLHTP